MAPFKVEMIHSRTRKASLACPSRRQDASRTPLARSLRQAVWRTGYNRLRSSMSAAGAYCIPPQDRGRSSRRDSWTGRVSLAAEYHPPGRGLPQYQRPGSQGHQGYVQDSGPHVDLWGWVRTWVQHLRWVRADSSPGSDISSKS